MERLLHNKAALITGASSGIGAVTAKLFAQEGAVVGLCARRAEKLEVVAEEIRAAGGRAVVLPGDVTDREDCRRVVDTFAQACGRIDILVNNAGDGDHHTTTVGASYEFWDKMINLNQNSVFHFCHEVLPLMEQAGSGVIVNVSAIAGVYGNAGVAYSAAKAAVIGITKNIAIQYAGKGIRCNAICPGPTLVDRMDGREEALYDKEFMATTERHMDMTIPFAAAEDQARVMLFLASDASRCITGQTIITDNGRCL